MAVQPGQNETERNEMFAIAAKEAQRLERLTTDFLAYARPRALRAVRTNVADLLNYVAATARARAIENQCYVILSGNVGNLPGVNNFDIQYGQSCILTPSDFLFARDGIAADSTPNIETVLFADLRLEGLARARNAGTVQNLKDRRYDLYETRWLRQSR